MIGLLIAAQAADGLTGILLPPGSEANPAAALLLQDPITAILAKLALVSLIVSVYAYRQRLSRFVVALGIAVGTVGFASNARVLVG